MRLLKNSVALMLVIILAVTAGWTYNYANEIGGENDYVPVVKVLNQDNEYISLNEMEVEGLKLEGNKLTIENYNGGGFIIESRDCIGSLEVDVKGNNVVNSRGACALNAKSTDIKFTGDGTVSFNEEKEVSQDSFKVVDGDFIIDGPRVIYNNSKDGIKVLSTYKEVEPETEETEENTEEVTEEVTEENTEEITEEVTEEVTEEITEEVTEEITEEVTEEITEEVTEEVTEGVTEENTEEVTEENNDNYGIQSVEEDDTESVENTEEATEDNTDETETFEEKAEGEFLSKEYCKFEMISGNLEIYLSAKEENIRAGKKVYGQGIFADNILLNGGTIKEEYQNDTKDISILAETKDGICEGIVLFANNDFVGNNTRIIFIIPGYDNKIKLHSENKSVNVNSKNIVYLDSSNIKDLKASLSQTRYDYDGKEKKPEVIIKGLINGVDYECKYVNNVNPGKPFVRVSGINMFKGVVDLPFEIVKKVTKPAVVKEEKKTDTKKTEAKKTDKKEIKKGLDCKTKFWFLFQNYLLQD